MTTYLTGPTSVNLDSSHAKQSSSVNSDYVQRNLTKTAKIDRSGLTERQQVAESTQQELLSKTVKQQSLSSDELNNSIQQLNSQSQVISRKLEFHIDDHTGRTVITVRDRSTEEVIRQIPSDQFLKTSEKLIALNDSKPSADAAKGILFTSKT